MPTLLNADALRRALMLRDLTDPGQGNHAIQLLIDEILDRVTSRWPVAVRLQRTTPIVSVQENYDRLLVPADSISREARYTRYLNDSTMLRTHASAMIPTALERLAEGECNEAILACPGIVYRRESIDRHHVGEPHQMDLWLVHLNGQSLAEEDLVAMIEAVVGVLPGSVWRTPAADHPYTLAGREILVRDDDEWAEVGECGLAHTQVLRSSGIDVPPASGLAMGLGLDRMLMLRKGIPDIRLLRSTDPRVALQMLDLDEYHPVSSMPPAKRDISVAVEASMTPEDVGDHVREALGRDALGIESIEILSETSYERLPAKARERLGISPGQKNVLMRISIRHLEKTLTDAEANSIRDRIYAVLHGGSVMTWAAQAPR